MAPVKGVFYPALVEAARQRIPRGPANLHALGVAGRLAAIAAKRAADAKAQADADRADRRRQRQHDRDPDVRAYRRERRRVVPRLAQVLDDARREYAAFLASETSRMHGGRKRSRADARRSA